MPDSRQTPITEPGDWKPHLSGRTCPECGTHHSRDACPTCLLAARVRKLAHRLDQAEAKERDRT